MRRPRQHKGMLVHQALAAIAVVALVATIAAAAYDYDQSSQQDRQQQQYQGRQRSMQSQGAWQQQQGQQSGTQGRNQQMERQVASQLRQEGFGQEGQIMVLAIGNRVILLGTVPDQSQKQRAEEATNQVSGVQQVDNRLQVSQGTGRQNDSQLQQSIQQQLRNQTSAGQNIQVRARNGRVTLSGQVNDWQEMADVLEAAFAAGAQNVTSQLSTSGQSQYGMGQDRWQNQQDIDQQGTGSLSRRYGRSYDEDRYGTRGGQTYDQTDRGYYPPYGYTPGQEDQTQWQDRQWQQRQGRMQQGQQGGMQQRGQMQMSASDLTLAHRIALQLQQQLPDKTIEIMDPQAIYVHVTQGTVMLHGAVLDNNQKRQAEQIARSVRGVQNVQNQLQVAGQGQNFQTFGYVPGQTDQSQMGGQSQWDNTSRQGQMGGMGSRYDQSQRGGSQSDQSGWDTGSRSQTGSGQSGQDQWGSDTQSDQSEWNTGSSQDQTGSTGSQYGASDWDTGGAQSSTSGTGGTSSQYGSADSQSSTSSAGAGRSSDAFASGSSSTSSQRGSAQQGQSSQQQMSAADKQLARQVEQKLQQQLPQANINVSANKGAVTLQGSVDQQNQKQQAEQIAKSVSGVQSVQNQINAGEFPALGYIPGQDRQRQQMGQQQGGASDAVLAHRIAMQLQQQFGGGQVVHVMNPQAIYIHVSQGTVTLHGSAQDQNQVQQIEQAVQNIRGVQNVQNQLEVGGQQQYGWQTGQQQYGQQTGQQYGRQAGQQMSASDQKLAQQIEQKLQSQLSNANINVTVSRGTATLQGSVQDNNQKQQAERIAKSISGVQNIRNNLSVGGQAGDYPALGYIPGQESQAQPDTGTGISGDTQCIQMFKQGLTDQNLQSMAQNIYVTCNQGTMALYGYVNSDDEKNQLEKATKQVSGVKKVDNNLIVRKEGAKQKSDSELQQDVESQLWWSPYVDSDKIKVSVQNGVVTLSGQVDDWDAMRAAVKNAFDAGAKRVKSQIQYSGQSGQQTATGDRSTAEHPSGIDSSAERQAESR